MSFFISTQEREDLSSVAHYEPLSFLAGKTILITGATGLIGSSLIKGLVTYNQLHQVPITIIGLVRDEKKAKDLFGSFSTDSCLSFLQHDILLPLRLDVPVHYIVHAASITTSSLFVSHPVETIETTVLGTRSILEFARQQKVLSMVYLSSMEVYGRVEESDQRTTEKDLGSIDILNVRSSYSESKRLVECMCNSYCKEYGVPVTIARLAQTFGPGIGKMENRVFAQFARSAIAKKDIILHTSGQSVGNYCYLSDAIKAIVMLLVRGTSGEAYTIVNEETSMTIAEMASLVACSIANNGIKVVFDIPFQTQNLGYAPETKLRLSSGKMEALGWHAEVNLEQAYQRLVASLCEEIDCG
jgi:nucleoside-diphosphate-sugar epimerase